MKTIGLLGGMSWESTLIYYKKINEYVKLFAGESHSAKIVMVSFDYHELKVLLEQDDWASIETRLSEAALKLQAIGADCVLICANTMHIAAEALQKSLSIPLIHIAKVTAIEAKQQKMTRVLLLGTHYTMRSDLYPAIFKAHDIEVITPSKRDQGLIHRIIYQELIHGRFLAESKQKLLDVIHQEDVDGVILGCTEIPMLIQQADLDIPLLDTLDLQAKQAVLFALDKT